MEDHIEIEYKGKTEQVKLKKLNWKENNEALREATKIEDGKPTYDFVSHQEYRLLKSIVTAPFELKIESLWDLDIQTGDKLFKSMMALNQISKEHQKNLQSPSIQKE